MPIDMSQIWRGDPSYSQADNPDRCCDQWGVGNHDPASHNTQSNRMSDQPRIVTCDDHVGPHVFREPDVPDESECTNPVDMPDFEHACTDLWSVGWYLCTCGEPWMNQAQVCMTQWRPRSR